MSRRNLRAFGLPIDPDQLLPPERYPFGQELAEGFPDLTDRARRLLALGRALASSPAWRDMDGAILVVRAEPPEGLAFLGNFSDEEASILEWLPAQLARQLPYFRHVSWRQAELDSQELASRLIARFGEDEIRSMQFAGIPRGGLIVLGLLSYALDLRPEQLHVDEHTQRPLVIVDDCALSGRRFNEFLSSRAADSVSDVVFAHLYSHPDLRKAVEQSEPRILAAVAARDLREWAPEPSREPVATLRSRGHEQCVEGVYLQGQFEHLGFPWSEPDIGVWTAARGQRRLGWRLVPPEACLKNRVFARSGALRLQLQSLSKGPFHPAPGVFHGEVDSEVLVAQVETSQMVVLRGVAADFWRGLLRFGEPKAFLDQLQQEYGVARDEIEGDVRDFLAELLRRGLVVHGPAFRVADDA